MTSLERLHSDYLWALCDADAHRAVDLENWWIFVNLRRGEWMAPLRPETVYDLVDTVKRRLGRGARPIGHHTGCVTTHATALLLAGVREHVVMRRLGHADIQTTLNLYGWVTEDVELRALADWWAFGAGWRGWEADDGPPLHPRGDTAADRPRVVRGRRRSASGVPDNDVRPVRPGRGPGLRRRGAAPVVLRTDSLPVPMRREISWWLASSYRTGNVSSTAGAGGRWVATALPSIADRPEVVLLRGSVAGRVETAPGCGCSTPITSGCQRPRTAIGPTRRCEGCSRAWPSTTATPPGGHTMSGRRRIDRRIPAPTARAHRRILGPVGRHRPDWLSEGMTFHVRLLLESGQMTWSTVDAAPWSRPVRRVRSPERGSIIPRWSPTRRTCGRPPWTSARSWAAGAARPWAAAGTGGALNAR